MIELPATVFHITHWKAGSQWVAEVLKQSAPERFVPWQVDGDNNPEFTKKPVEKGKIYGTVYLPRDEFENALATSPENRTDFGNSRKFVVIRDLRDTLISLYFSGKISHKIINERLDYFRKTLNNMDNEAGLLAMLVEGLGENAIMRSARIQQSWLRAENVLLLCYEDFLGNETAIFEKIFDYCKLDIDRGRLDEIIKFNTFEFVAGRKRGEEDPNSHLRKGIPGDWKNHFSERLKNEFKDRYGQLLVETGYEKDLNW